MNTREHLMAGFAKVADDLHFLITCFDEVLRELGRPDLAARLPWTDSGLGISNFGSGHARPVSEPSAQPSPGHAAPASHAKPASLDAAAFPPGTEAVYSIAFGLLNMVEENAAAAVRRAREATQGSLAERGLWGHHLACLRESGFEAEDIARVTAQTCVEPVLTAHPTEAKRLPVLEAYRALYALLRERDSAQFSRLESDENRDAIKATLERLWRTGEISRDKPGIEAERRNVMHYLSEVFPAALPDLDARLRRAWTAVGLPEGALHDDQMPQLRFGTWVGGDRDGHPLVTTDVTGQTLRELRRGGYNVLRHLLSDLVGKLSLSSAMQEPPAGLREATERLLGEESGNAAVRREVVARHGEEPWRAFVELLICKLPPESDSPQPGFYARPVELLSDLSVLRASLEEVGAGRLARSDVAPIQRAAQTFGFHLAALDIRQNSKFHDLAISQLMCAIGMDAASYPTWPEGDRLRFLNNELRSPRPFLHPDSSAGPEADAVLSCYRLLARHLEAWGSDGLGSLIVSMTRQLSDLLGVYVLAREAGLCRDTPSGLICRLPVVPLFETLDDLRRAPSILQAFLEHPVTRRSLETKRGQNGAGAIPGGKSESAPFADLNLPPFADSPMQQVMIGYSDSNKDAGIWASQWGLQKAQGEMARAANDVGVRLRFFHGRGGTISRGAGPTYRFLEALPHRSLSGDIRLTEQGETIAQKYANIPTATYNLELLLAGVTSVTLRGQRGADETDWDDVAEFLTERSHRAYRALLETEGFVAFFRTATPLDALEHSRIGSRPARRTGAASLDDLRAIPWVFAWNQARFYLPGWYGIGTALQQLADERPEEFARLQAGIGQWSFGGYVLTNVETNLSSADPELMRAYADLVGDEELRWRFMGLIESEFARAEAMLDHVFGRPLAERRPRMIKTLQLRAEALRTLHGEQIALLRSWREAGQADPDRAEGLLTSLLLTVNAIAGGLRTTG